MNVGSGTTPSPARWCWNSTRDVSNPMNDTDRNGILSAPQLRLIGSVDEAMYAEFRNQLSAAPTEGPLVIALTTLGGNPEVARAMADDVRLLREAGRTIYFLGKSAVYSAGATFMAGFPVECRSPSSGCGKCVIGLSRGGHPSDTIEPSLAR